MITILLLYGESEDVFYQDNRVSKPLCLNPCMNLMNFPPNSIFPVHQNSFESLELRIPEDEGSESQSRNSEKRTKHILANGNMSSAIGWKSRSRNPTCDFDFKFERPMGTTFHM